MARKRKRTASNNKKPQFQQQSQVVRAGGRSALQNLQTIGYKLNHALLINDFETKTPRGQDADQSQISQIISFNGIPSCALSAKGTAPTKMLAQESAAHAMLDFFRLAINPQFVHQLSTCDDDDAIEPLIPAVRVVFDEFKKAIAADFLSITRCSQLEMTSAATLRGREVKKRVLLNCKKPYIGYQIVEQPDPMAPPPVIVYDDDSDEGSDSGARKSEDVPPKSSPEIITLDDDDSEESMPSSSRISTRKSTPNSDKPNKILSPIPLRTASPQVKHLREADRVQRKFIEEQLQVLQGNRRQITTPESSVYFGEPNTSNQGPSDVFCCLPTANRSMQYTEAEYSDEEEGDDDDSDDVQIVEQEDEDEEEEEDPVPMKRARQMNGDSVVLNTTSTMMNGGLPGTSGTFDTPEKRLKESDEEIGDIVDEWDESDDVATVEEIPDNGDVAPSAVSTTPTPSKTRKGLYDGLPNHKAFLASRGLPANYQARTIGVVVNEKLCSGVEKYVESVTSKSLNDVAKLSKLAWDHYLYNSQPDAVYDLKMHARVLLFNEIQKLFPEKCVSLQVTGSTINGCGAHNSDVDMCLCFPTTNYRGFVFDDFQNDRQHSTKVLRKIDRAIKRCKWEQPLKRMIRKCELVPAKVPIIKLVLNSKEFNNMEVDINVNNIAGIYNSHLTHYYSLTDARFPVLALLVKHWAGANHINDAQNGYFNSYTIILLVVHFLQCGVTPAILPNLQYLFPDKFDKKLPLDELRLYGDIADKLPANAPNTWSIGELFIGFFYYYTHFDFATQAISIRSAQVVPRSLLPRDTVNYPLFIEEPFDAVNTARSVRTPGHFHAIKAEFRRALAVFNAKKFSMRSLGVTVNGDF